MKNDIYALLYKKGTEAGKNYTETAERKKSVLLKLFLGAGLPLLAFIGYQYMPTRLSREVTAEDRQVMEREAKVKKLEVFYSNAGSYGESKDLGPLETAFRAGKPGKARTAAEEQIAALIKNGADVLAYHSVGRILDGKVEAYAGGAGKDYSRTVRTVTSDPAEFSEDLVRSMKRGKGTIVALLGSGREHFNILPDGSIDPNCSAGILKRFKKDRPGYSDKLKVIFFHPYSPDSMFGQPEHEAGKFHQIAEMGWKSAFLGIDLGKDELAKPLLTENGWQDREFWPEGPGAANFLSRHVLLDKKLTAARLKKLVGGAGMADFYWLPWAALPKDRNAVAELAKAYDLVFIGYTGEKFASGSPGIVPARVMGSK